MEFPLYVFLFHRFNSVSFISDILPPISLCPTLRGICEQLKVFGVGTSDNLGTTATCFEPSGMELGLVARITLMLLLSLAGNGMVCHPCRERRVDGVPWMWRANLSLMLP